MNNLLSRDTPIIVSGMGDECEVVELIGGGGQGEVYRARYRGQEVALKWYYVSSATSEQREALETLIDKGAPNDRFLWPQALASSPNVPGFGYIMPLRAPNYKGIVDLMKGRSNPSFRALATAGFQLADSFYQLHTQGLCYRDISFGNVFFDEETGDILICDNDNVAIDGNGSATVIGTPRFMAPEIVRGEASPNSSTDLYSLSALLFYLFFVHHPLEGAREASIKCLDLPAMNRLYGEDPLFIFDPNDQSNRPQRGYHDNATVYWPIYPEDFRELFIRAFTDGLSDPLNGRVRETEWRAAMIQLRDSIFYCNNCTAENFYDRTILESSKTQTCWNCKVEPRLPGRIRIGESIVMLNSDTELYPHHLDDNRRYDFSEPCAKVSQNPNDRRIWGLTNLSDTRWSSTTSDGQPLDIPPGRTIKLSDGLRIHFGKVSGQIRFPS